MELCLSEAFQDQREGLKPALECRATILNINSGHNRELMKKCHRLQEYAEFIGKIRENLQKGMLLEKAVERAMEYCLSHGILVDILQKSQMEVRSMLLEEYDEKAEREYLKKESLEQGITLGNFEMLADFVEDGTLSLEQAKKRVKGKEEEFLSWYQKRQN